MTKEASIERSFNFGTGVHIDQAQIKKWHEEVLKTLKEGGSYTSRSSGNSMVIARRVTYSHEPMDEKIEVIEISNGYASYTYSTGQEPKISDSIIRHMNEMTDEQRLKIINHYCSNCGSRDTGCQCLNDE